MFMEVKTELIKIMPLIINILDVHFRVDKDLKDFQVF